MLQKKERGGVLKDYVRIVMSSEDDCLHNVKPGNLEGLGC